MCIGLYYQLHHHYGIVYILDLTQEILVEVTSQPQCSMDQGKHLNSFYRVGSIPIPIDCLEICGN